MIRALFIVFISISSVFAIENLTYFGRLVRQENGSVFFELRSGGRISGELKCFRFDEDKINLDQFIEVDNVCLDEIVYSKEKK